MSSESPQPYRVLARKYRPQSFGELIGQEAMVKTLANAIARDRLAHSFLLTGVRGVGKTSTARLIAKALNCIGPDGLGAWFSDAVSGRDAIVGAVTVALAVAVGMALGAWALGPGALIGTVVGMLATAFIVRLRGRLDGDGLGACVEISMLATLVGLAVIAP